METHLDALSMMKAMRRAMFVRENKHGRLFDIVERAVANPAFVCEFVLVAATKHDLSPLHALYARSAKPLRTSKCSRSYSVAQCVAWCSRSHD